MQKRFLGKTGWRVTPIGLGCWQFGGAITLDGKPDGWTGVTDDESLATIRRAAELGVNFFDTADMYGWGHSEELVGQALKPFRDRVYIATKVGFWHDDDNRRTYNDSREYIMRACDASLTRLKTDRIDLYQCHLGRTERWPEFLGAFETLQRQGKIRFFGISTNDFEMVQRFDEHRNLATVQSTYNLLDRRAESEILPYCRARGIAFIARTTLARGLLTGKYTKISRFDADDIRSKWLDEPNLPQFERDMAVVERLKPIADRAGFSLAQLAIKFILSHVAVSVVLTGTKNRSQVENNYAAGILPPPTTEEIATIEKALQL